MTTQHQLTAADSVGSDQSAVFDVALNPPSAWLLPSANYVPAKMPMTAVFPRPDIETNVNARQKHAYYDGTNSIEYRIPIVVQGGARPLRYEVTAGPAGMTVGEQYGDADYGIVKWTPSGTVTNQTCTVRVYSQDFGRAGALPVGGTADEFIDITWTVSTGTSEFVFVDDSAVSNGVGTYSDPHNTLENAVGSDFSDTTNANKLLYFFAGQYTVPTHASTNNNLKLDRAHRPMIWVGIPGQTVEITHADANINWGPGSSSVSDSFFGQLTLKDRNASGAARSCNMSQVLARGTWHEITWRNIYNNPPQQEQNLGCITFLVGSTSTYISVVDCTFDNVHQNFDMYDVQYLVVERCTNLNQTTALPGFSNQVYFFKDSIQDMTCAFNEMVGQSSNGFIYNVYGQAQRHENNRWEVCYNKGEGGAGSPDTDIAIGWSGGPANFGPYCWVYRNTVNGRIHDNLGFASGSEGPIYLDRNVAGATVNNRPPQVLEGTGEDSNVEFASLDANLDLSGTDRTNYLGTKGAEISS